MYSVKFAKVHVINEDRFVRKMYPRLNSQCKPAASDTETHALDLEITENNLKITPFRL